MVNSPQYKLLDFLGASIKDLHKICQPLSLNRISYFCYAECTYSDTSAKGFCMDNNLEWTRAFFSSSCEQDPEYYKNIQASMLTKNKIFYTFGSGVVLAKEFGFQNVFNIIYNKQNRIEKYTFANFDKDDDLTDFYLNNLDLLHRFILYFQFKTRNLTKEAFNNKAYVNINFNLFHINDKLLNQKERDQRNLFIQETEITKIQVKDSNFNLYITKKELECLHLLAIGKTMKEIANVLNISSRTVEDHLNNIKFKTGFDL
jgi:hypothetical protein